MNATRPKPQGTRSATPERRRATWWWRVIGLVAWLGLSAAAFGTATEAAPPADPTPASPTEPAPPDVPPPPGAPAPPAPAPAGESAPPATANAEPKPPSKFQSPEDGEFDMSGFLDQAYGFLPVLTPITEPAVGYGAGLGLLFIDRPLSEAQAGLDRPDITVVGGLATDNGSRGAVAGDMRYWLDNRVQTVGGVFYASVNLDFYGIGDDSLLKDRPIHYTLEPLGGGVRGRYRFGDSRLWGGLSYVLMDTKIAYGDDASALPDRLDLPEDSRIGGLTPSIAFDSRDNLFTPITGTYLEGTAGFYAPSLGGDDTFQRVGLLYMGYWKLHPRVMLGVKGSATLAFGETPFYVLPYVSLRGAPVMRYQGEEAADVETEVRWQCWRRWSVVGFVGGGAAWNDLERIDNVVTVATGGAGFRYELARRYGIHAGLDVAVGPDGTAFYIVVGSAWARP